MVLTQNLESILHDMVTENAELQQRLQSSERQLMRMKAELTRAEKTIRREQQLVQAEDRELVQAQQKRHLRSSEALVADLQKTLQQWDSQLETLRSKVSPPSFASLPPVSQCMHECC